MSVKRDQIQETVHCNDELVINSLEKNIKTLQNPYTRRIVIFKPFPLVMGQVLPHLEIEFLSISNDSRVAEHQDGLVQHQLKMRAQMEQKINFSLDRHRQRLVNVDVSTATSGENNPQLSKLGYSTQSVEIPTTIIEPFLQPHQSRHELSQQQDLINQLPLTLVFPSMSHSSNVTNPLYSVQLNSRLNRFDPDRPLLRFPADQNTFSFEDIANYFNIPSHFVGEAGWWNSFVRPSFRPPTTALEKTSPDHWSTTDQNIAIDLHKTHLLSLSPLGSAYGTSSALSIDPHKMLKFQKEQNTPLNSTNPNFDDVCFRSEFPIITPFDQATAAVWLMDALGLVKVHGHDEFMPTPLVSEVLPGVPTILPAHLLEHSVDNYKKYVEHVEKKIQKEKEGTIKEATPPQSQNSPPSKQLTPTPTPTPPTEPINPNAVIGSLQAVTSGLYTPSPLLNIGHRFPQPRVLDLLQEENQTPFQQDQPQQQQQQQLHAVVGSSMGGQSALALASLYPHLFTRCAAICSTSRTTPHTQAIRTIQRRAITNDENWNNGDFRSTNIPRKGLELSRMIGILNYRSVDEFNGRFASNHNADTYKNEVEYYLQHIANKFTTFNPLCYLTLSKSMDLMDISMVSGNWLDSVKRMGHRSGKNKATDFASSTAITKSTTKSSDPSTTLSDPSTTLSEPSTTLSPSKSLQTEYLLLGIKEDELIPYHELQSLGQALGKFASTHYETISSKYGHDAFLLDVKQFAPRLGVFLLPPPAHCGTETNPNQHTGFNAGSEPTTTQKIGVNKDCSGTHALSRYLKSVEL